MASFLVGALLGLAFFRGLWSTVKALGQVRHPGLWMLGSLLLRYGLALAAFYFLARYAGWTHVLAAAVGFTIARLSTVHRVTCLRIDKESDA
jgi:F1F0 ATPase subunit 2